MIHGQLINLAAVEPDNARAYHQWINDEETNQWRGLHHPTNFDEAQSWIEQKRKVEPSSLSLSIITKEDKVHIGFVGLQNICSRSRRAEFWIYIGSKSHWGQNIGEDVTRAICTYAFKQMNLNRIWLECNPEYSRVVRCYEKVGFVQEGRLRKAYYRDGEFRDTCIMGLLRDDLKVGSI